MKIRGTKSVSDVTRFKSKDNNCIWIPRFKETKKCVQARRVIIFGAGIVDLKSTDLKCQMQTFRPSLDKKYGLQYLLCFVLRLFWFFYSFCAVLTEDIEGLGTWLCSCQQKTLQHHGLFVMVKTNAKIVIDSLPKCREHVYMINIHRIHKERFDDFRCFTNTTQKRQKWLIHLMKKLLIPSRWQIYLPSRTSGRVKGTQVHRVKRWRASSTSVLNENRCRLQWGSRVG